MFPQRPAMLSRQAKHVNRTGTAPQPEDKIRALVSAGFMPLPLKVRLVDSGDGLQTVVSRAHDFDTVLAIYDPAVATAMIRNGEYTSKHRGAEESNV